MHTPTQKCTHSKQDYSPIHALHWRLFGASGPKHPVTLNGTCKKQEWAGRDGEPSNAILYTVDLTVEIAKEIKEYFRNKLYEEFSVSDKNCCDTLCRCCDVCENLCKCLKCNDLAIN